MRIRPTIVLLLVAPMAAMAQRVSGTVRAGGASAPMSGAVVASLDLDGKVLVQTGTDTLGRYELMLSSAARQLRAIRIGHRPVVVSLTRTSADTSIDFTLEVIRELDTVVTTAAEQRYDVPRLQEFEARRKSGMGGRFVAEDELRKMEGQSMQTILRTFIPGIRIHQYRGGQFAASASTPSMRNPEADRLGPRGPTGCWVSVYLDGVMIFDRFEGGVSPTLPTDINNIMALNLAGIEYYANASSTPIKFKSLRNNCGSLLFWTRGGR